MSGLETAAAIIGITDVSIRSIQGLYGIIQAYRDVPNELERFQGEIASLQANLNGLTFLNDADEQVIAEVRSTGVAQAINSSGEACDQFKVRLALWVKHGPDGFRSKLNLLRNQKTIDKLWTKMWVTGRLLDSAVGILDLKVSLQTRSQSEKLDKIEMLTKQVASWKMFSQRELQEANDEIARLSAVDDVDADDAIEELEMKKANLVQFQEAAARIQNQYQSMKLTQITRNIHTGVEAETQIGMSDAAADKVGYQETTDVWTYNKGKTQIGVGLFSSSKSPSGAGEK